MSQQIYKHLVMTKNSKTIKKNENCIKLIFIIFRNFYTPNSASTTHLITYPNPANPPIWKIRNETIYAVTNVMAHIVNAHL